MGNLRKAATRAETAGSRYVGLTLLRDALKTPSALAESAQADPRARVQCDQQRPGCSQCAKVGVECPGYRDMIDLMFRDETLSTSQKAKTKKARSSKTPPAKATAGVDGSSSSGSDHDTSMSDSGASPPSSSLVPFAPNKVDESGLMPQLLKPLEVDLEAMAISFFMNAYADPSRFDYLPSLYASICGSDSALQYSVKAAALASLASEFESPDISHMSRNYYLRGIHATNEALASKTRSLQDETLASILVLGLFESLAPAEMSSYANWEAHINGATALLKLRGKAQFEKKLGTMLYTHAADAIRMQCFHHCISVPEHIVELERFSTPQLYGMHLHSGNMINHLANLRRSIQERGPTEPYEVMKELYEAYEGLRDRMRRTPPRMSYETHHMSVLTPSAISPVYHIHKNHKSLRMWMTYGMLELWLCSAMNHFIKYVAANSISRPANFFLDLEHISQLTAERCLVSAYAICASMPQIMGEVPSPHGVPALNSVTGLSLIWPLSLIIDHEILPSELRAYASAQLRRLGVHMKLPQAIQAADALDGQARSNTWWSGMSFGNMQGPDLPSKLHMYFTS